MNTTRMILSADIDGTLIGKPDATHSLDKFWNNIPEKTRPYLCYNTGRLLQDTLELIEKTELPAPDYIISGVGTVIYDYKKETVLKAFEETLVEGWDLKKVEEIISVIPEIVKQPRRYQNRYKSSWYLHGAEDQTIQDIQESIDSAGIKGNVIYSSSRDLDILPLYANKGNAIVWLAQLLGLENSQIIVAGDTGNDVSMFQVKDVKRILVENAQPELHHATISLDTYYATRPFADGVIEGLKFFEIQSSWEPSAADASVDQEYVDPKLAHMLPKESCKTLKDEEKDLIDEAYKRAVSVIRKNITPLGFSACSLTENTFQGTDQNYQSVWGRDGAITVINTLSLDDQDIQECQKKTLLTLLDNVNYNGQVPSNVNIITGEPDYSGVGGIASIDSGLWLIIALHQYARKTHDFQIIRDYFPTISKIMTWLGSQDSNADDLLEIPEAGDWTDLFGRSYNVLYDEVLWYKAVLSFGRICEILGETQQAGFYLRKAQIIKEKINYRFWPDTRNELMPNSFADQQNSMGTSSYLIAEVTPFGFDWRCDVFGNILAGVFNILSVERAKTAFRFMWGVGVNEPYPVQNLYPTVNAGDPDWRSYYVVNLLNLPHHYHNGGIWPFIGAYWVRFISRLGLSDLAQRELLNLAKLNKQGSEEEWEFNEWVHGKTGRAMGKRYQAWSAAGFIQAYSEVHFK